MIAWFAAQRRWLGLWRWWFTGAMLMVLFLIVMSLIKLGALPIKVSGGDKLLHTFAYGVLVLTWMQLFNGWKVDALIALCAFLLGVSLEIAQSFHPLRHMDFYDVIANSLGIGAGYLVGVMGLRKLTAWFERVVLKFDKPADVE